VHVIVFIPRLVFASRLRVSLAMIRD